MSTSIVSEHNVGAEVTKSGGGRREGQGRYKNRVAWPDAPRVTLAGRAPTDFTVAEVASRKERT